MTSHRLVVLPCVAVLLSVVALAPHGLTTQTEQLDLVLAGGRVLDPETGLDAPRNVGIREGKIVAVTVEPLEARETLDVHGLVVAPGFIDLHAHGQDSESYRYYAHDGVTTALELELGTYPVASWYAVREGRSLINYGVSVGHVGARRALITHDESLPGAAAIGDKSRSAARGDRRRGGDGRFPARRPRDQHGPTRHAAAAPAHSRRTRAWPRCHHGSVSVHRGVHRAAVSGVRSRLAAAHEYRLSRYPLPCDRRAADRRQLRTAAPAGRGRRDLPDSGQHGAADPGGLARDGGERRPFAPWPPAARGHPRPRPGALRARLRRAQPPGRGAQDDPAAGPTARASRAGDARQRSDPGGCGRRHHRVRPRARRGGAVLRAAGAVLAGDLPR